MQVVASSAAVAAVVTGTLNLFTTYLNSRQAMGVEQFKQNAQVKGVRYTRVLETLEEARRIPRLPDCSILVDGELVQDDEAAVKAAVAHYNGVRDVYLRARVLLDENLIAQVDELERRLERDIDSARQRVPHLSGEETTHLINFRLVIARSMLDSLETQARRLSMPE